MKRVITVLVLSILAFSGMSQCQDSIFVSGHTLNAGVSGFNYQWYSNCNSNSPGGITAIPGATNQTYTPTNFATGYSVVISSPTCVDSSTCVSIDSNCRAYFYPTQTTPGQVILVDSSYGAGPVMSYVWNFGDGFVAATQFPTHTYSSPGTYQVTLYILDSLSGCSNFFHDTITVDSAGILRSGFSVTVISHNSVGVNELKSEIEFNVFPNPANDIVNVSFARIQEEGMIELLDISGKLIVSKSVNGLIKTSIETQSLKAGIYLIRASSQTGKTTKKLIVE